MSLTIDRIKQYKEIDMELSKLVHLYFDKIIKCNSSYCLEDWYIRNTDYNEIEINYTCTDHNGNLYYESTIATLDELNENGYNDLETISEIVPHPLIFNPKTQPCVLTNHGIVTDVINFD